MNRVTFHNRRRAQTLVFFLLSFGVIVLLCGLAIDSGLLYLSKARLARAVDGAALAAVGNFNRSSDPLSNRNAVAQIVRNLSVANFSDLGGGPNGGISSALPSPTTSSYTLSDGSTGLEYTYNFNDGTQDSGNYRRFVAVTLQTGAGGQITSCSINARCPATTYFIGFAGAYFRDLKVSSSATASRNPRLIMVVVDRSSSMLASGGGAYGLPNAIVDFMSFFDTSSDYIGLVSFSGNARLEFPPTTNFLIAATNNLLDTYNTNYGTPGIDPEMVSANPDYDPNYAATGVRRMKFGGSTCADEGIRMGLEQMMANPGYENPNVTKYLVIFTDGAWNCVRTLLAAPGYTNIVTSPQTALGLIQPSLLLSGASLSPGNYTMPIMSPYLNMSNTLVNLTNGSEGDYTPSDHANDTWQSADGLYEPNPGAPAFQEGQPVQVTAYPTNGATTYATNVDVWLQPGSVDYSYDSSGNIVGTYVSDYTNPTNTVTVAIPPGGKNMLVVPGYVAEGNITDSLDLNWWDDYLPNRGYNLDGFAAQRESYMWPDSIGNPAGSLMRSLLYRNFPNLLNGYYIFRPDDPSSTATEPITGAIRPLYGLSAYYPSPGVYWPFDSVGFNPGGVTGHTMLRDPLSDPTPGSTDVNNDARNLEYTINMLSSNAAPEWSGELFYKGTGGTTNVTGISSNPVSTQITNAADYQSGASGTPGGWLANFISHGLAPVNYNAYLINDSSHYGTGVTNIINGQVLRAVTFNGSNSPVLLGGSNACLPNKSDTGGFVTDGHGDYFSNAMAYSGRPTHYYDFSQSKWVPFHNQHDYENNLIAIPLDEWKAQEYCWHARAAGVKIYTVGYGSHVDDAQQVLLAQIANATNTTGYGGSNIAYNPLQPIGEEFQATTTNEIISDFQTIAQAISAALTQ